MRGKRKTLVGTVHSNKMEKTITVDIERRFKHRTYGKYVVRTNRFHVHDEKQDAGIGDRVEFVETRPLSKNKCWRLLRIIERAPRFGEESPA